MAVRGKLKRSMVMGEHTKYEVTEFHLHDMMTFVDFACV